MTDGPATPSDWDMISAIDTLLVRNRSLIRSVKFPVLFGSLTAMPPDTSAISRLISSRPEERAEDGLLNCLLAGYSRIDTTSHETGDGRPNPRQHSQIVPVLRGF